MKGWSYSRPNRSSRYFSPVFRYIHDDSYNVRVCNKEKDMLKRAVQSGTYIIK